MTDWSEVRKSFPVLDRYAYLNSGSFGPWPGCAIDAIKVAATAEGLEGRIGAAYNDRLLSVRESVRSVLASILGANSDEVALTSDRWSELMGLVFKR